MPDRGDSWLGRTLDGRYRVQRLLGEGGMGQVFVAEQLNIARSVALKLMHPEDTLDPERVARFKSEAKLISELRHPNTLKLFDYGITQDGTLFLVTELLTGQPLSEALKAGPLDVGRTLRILRQICASLSEAHDRGIVHRDLKPANIFLDRVGDQEVVKVLDFGIAKVNAGEALSSLGGDAPATAGGILVGTPAYMSPEQVLGRPLDGRSDLYALGVVAYRCLAGRLPFEGEAVAQLAAHAYEAPPPLPKNVAPAVAKLVLQLLAKDPQDRPNSAQALTLRLDALGQPGPTLPRWVPAVIGASLGVAAAGLWLALQGPTINTVAIDAGFLDADVGDALTRDADPEDATEIDVGFLDATEIDAGDEVILITGDWRAPQAVRQAAQRPLATAQECAQAPAVVRFEVTRAGTSISVTGEQAEALRRCLLLRLDDPVVWGTSVATEGAVELRLD